MCMHLQSFLHFLFGFGIFVFEDVVSCVQIQQNLTRGTLGTGVCVHMCKCFVYIREQVCVWIYLYGGEQEEGEGTERMI